MTGDENGGVAQGWTLGHLPDIAHVIMGQSPPGSTYNTRRDGLPFFQGKSEFTETSPVVRQWCTAPSRVALPGDILMSIRAPVGPTNIADRECAIGRGLAIIRPREGISRDYVRAAIRLREDEIASWGTGTTFTAINKTHLASITFPLAPSAEQRRIAERLYEVEDRRARIATHLHAALVAITRFRGAVLAAACSGRLTHDLRDEATHGVTGDAPATWRRAPLGDLVDSIRGGSSEVPIDVITEYPVLRSSSVRPLNIDYDDVRHLSEAQSSKTANFVEEGDLLVTRLNGNIDYVGNAAVVTGLGDRRVQYPDRLFRIRLNEPSNARYLELFFASPRARTQVEAASRSAAGHQRISISDLKSFSIDIPPPEEQREMVRRVDGMLAIADRVATQIDRVAGTLDHASRASLAKAFRGELVPTEATLAEDEGRDYESADELMARIDSANKPTPPPRREVAS